MKILILSNNQGGLYLFRRELIERLLADHHHVFISVPEDEYTEEMLELGKLTLIHNVYLDRRGTNPVQDLRLMNYYKSMMKTIRPDVVLTYTIKPNVYGGIVCGRLGIPCIANVTGLGTSIENGGMMQKITLMLYKNGLKHAKKVFFQNETNRTFMLQNGVIDKSRTKILPGSGVNTEQHCYEPYPSEYQGDSHVYQPKDSELLSQAEQDAPSADYSTGRKIIFTTIGRIMRDKGIEEILAAAMIIRKRHPETEFRLIGDFDEGYEDRVRELDRQGVVRYLGFQKDIHAYMAESHAILHASYHEGMSNVLQEAASTGRPVIATDVPGCIETFEPDVTGISFHPHDADSLVEAIESFLSLSHEEKEQMGKAGREKMIREFDRKIVVEQYISAING